MVQINERGRCTHVAAYIVARVSISDWERYREYLKVTPSVIAQFGGKVIARGGEIVTLEGPTETRRVVLIEFPTLEIAKEFYNSPEYQEAKKLRETAASGQLIAIDGTP